MQLIISRHTCKHLPISTITHYCFDTWPPTNNDISSHPMNDDVSISYQREILYMVCYISQLLGVIKFSCLHIAMITVTHLLLKALALHYLHHTTTLNHFEGQSFEPLLLDNCYTQYK